MYLHLQVNVALGGDRDTSESLARRSAIRARLEDLDANHDGEPMPHCVSHCQGRFIMTEHQWGSL